MFCICFFRIIQCSSREGEEDGELYQGDLKLTGAGNFGKERGDIDIRVLWNSPAMGRSDGI